MNRAKKNKRKKNKQKHKNNNKSDNYQDNIQNFNNAAPLFDQLKEDEKYIEDKGNYGPPEDVSLKWFNDYINTLNKIKITKLNLNHYEGEEFDEPRSLKLMKRVNEKDLILNNIHYNCFILLEITSAVLSLASLQFFADDENNNRMLISIYNYQGIFTINSFKQGSYMIIKEPYYKQYMDLQIGIRVDNPYNIELFKDKEEANNYIIKEKK